MAKLRKCTDCKENLELNSDNFHKVLKTTNPKFKGFTYRCKKCDAVRNRNRNLHFRTAIARYNEKYPERVKARALARKYAHKKEACETCGGKKNLQLHHPDIRKALEVVTLCRSCHYKIHYTPNP